MKLGIIFLITSIFIFDNINCDSIETDKADYDFNVELLFKALRQNVTLPTRRPPKKTVSPPKNTTSSTLTVKPAKPDKNPSAPPKNTTLSVKPDSATQEQSTAVPSVTTFTPLVTTPTVTNNGRCKCAHGQCSCCTGSVLAAFNQKACLNMTYDPDDFAFTTIMSVNQRVVYKNTFSGKNPPPICVRLPRLRAVKVCAIFSNIYFSGSNMHTCIDFEANWEDVSLFETSFDCIRFGTNGIGVIPPEEGGGANVVDEEDEDIDDYDDSAR